MLEPPTPQTKNVLVCVGIQKSEHVTKTHQYINVFKNEDQPLNDPKQRLGLREPHIPPSVA